MTQRGQCGRRSRRGPARRAFLDLAARVLDRLLPRSCPICDSALEPGSGTLCPVCDGLAAVDRDARTCGSCGKKLHGERGLCMECRLETRAYEAAQALYPYSGFGSMLVGAYKFKGRRELAAFFASRLSLEISARWHGWTIVPVPPRPSKLREKGWDQVELIARRLEAEGFPVARILERLPSLEQKRLDKEGRKENARKSYRVRRDRRAPRLALILDDVFTTGATVDACARALKGSGAERVAVIALAREA